VILVLNFPVDELVDVLQLLLAVSFDELLIFPHGSFFLLDISECLSHQGTKGEEQFGGFIKELTEQDHIDTLSLLGKSAN
jgi:hypothetical protein